MPARRQTRPALSKRSGGRAETTDSTPEGSAARDRAALAAALDPIITINASGVIQSSSDSVERVLGWTPAELIGRNVSVLMPEPHRSAHDGYLANYLRTGKTNIMNRPRRFDAARKDGTLLPIELCVSQASAGDGRAPMFVGIIRDMSAVAEAERTREEERVRYQQLLADQTSALQQAHLQLRMADRMASIGTLAAGLGHDMHNVLLPVRARLNALRAAGAAGRLPESEREHVDEIRKSIAYLQQLADGLHFLALDPDTDEDERGGGGETNLVEWWEQAGALLCKAVPKHVRVSAALSADLPPVAMAPHGLTQAVLNLVVNAGEAIPKPRAGEASGEVRIWAKAGRGGAGERVVTLGVTDNGPGMTDEVRRRAFDMFFTTKPRGLGTGLGLALVRKVADRVGGEVAIESAPGKGTTVRMTIPLAAAAGADKGSASSAAAISVRDGRAAGLIRLMLEGAGAGVEEHAGAGSPGSAAVWVVEPDRSRLDAAREWLRRRRGARLVVFGAPGRAERGAWLELGAIMIDSPDDLASVRVALAKAMRATEEDVHG